MNELLAWSAKFINIEEVGVAKRQADQLSDQEKSHCEKGNSKEIRLPKL